MTDEEVAPFQLNPAEAAELRKKLEQRRSELDREVKALGEPKPSDTANLQFGKRIGDGTTYAIERMTGAFQARTLYETVKQIDAALRRLDEGTYGRCEQCGAHIQPERLVVLPWAGLCIRCASRRSSGR
jgi:DnaK suppressor protein